MSRAIEQENPYQKKLLKLLPSESVAAYLAAINVIPANIESVLLHVIVLIAITILTPLYLIRLMELKLKNDLLQIVFITVSFVVWAFAISGEKWIPGLAPYIFLKSLIMIIWTAFIPVFIKRKPA
ncbi:unnamed protein product [marine sediment metagenome]|uniref:Uncharacterized protein n=1 Tax=marine sediment metagenome TaxID=412755 RepID=X0YFM9_9ZZZZ